jgi:uncharacterized SAM-binding protein YcdF (DUF218 family)
MTFRSGGFGTSVRILVSILSVAFASTVGLVLGAPTLNRWLARSDPLPISPPLAIVALSSYVRATGELDLTGAERLRAAVTIAHRYPEAMLLTTRVRNEKAGATSDFGQRVLLQRIRAPLARWSVIDGEVRSTRDEALRARVYLANDSGSIVVVTSQTHARRACAAFEKVGFRVTCRFVITESGRWWLPAYTFLYEQAATLEYSWRGWIQ